MTELTCGDSAGLALLKQDAGNGESEFNGVTMAPNPKRSLRQFHSLMQVIQLAGPLAVPFSERLYAVLKITEGISVGVDHRKWNMWAVSPISLDDGIHLGFGSIHHFPGLSWVLKQRCSLWSNLFLAGDSCEQGSL